MKTDVEIAQEAQMQHIREIAAKLGLTEDDIELYGKYKAKISLDAWNKVKNGPDGKLVLVTAINPTPAGEGKTTTSVGLADAFHKLGHKVAVALREPSLGPCFGLKGGAAGGGRATGMSRGGAYGAKSDTGSILAGSGCAGKRPAAGIFCGGGRGVVAQYQRAFCRGGVPACKLRISGKMEWEDRKDAGYG